MRPLSAACVVVFLAAFARPVPAQGVPGAGAVEVEELRDLAPPADPLKKLEAEAEAAYGDGELDRAIGLYRDLVAQTPAPADQARILVTVGWLEMLQGHAEAAGPDLERALYLAPETRLREELYNDEFVRLFLDSQARATAARAADAADRARAAVQAITAGNLASARQLLAESLALQPDQPRALYNLAVVDLRDGQTDAALAGFERVISLGEARPETVPAELRALARASAGLVYLTRGQDPEAAAALEQAVALNPADGRAWNGLGVARDRLGTREKSIEAFRRAYALRPDDEEVADHLGRALIDAGRWVDAVAVLVESCGRRPQSPRLFLSLGLAERGLGNLDGARRSFERVLELDPTDGLRLAEQASVFLASLHLEGGRAADAAREARRALAWNENLPDSWTHLGMAQKELGDLPGAKESLARAAALAPDRPEAAYNLGTVLLALRDFVAARAAFERAVALRPGFAEAEAILTRLAAPSTAPANPTPAARTTPAPPRLPLGTRFTEANYPELGLRGLRVDALERGGLGERAGLQTQDLVLRVDGRPLTTVADLLQYLAGRPARSTLLFDLLRAGRSLRISVALD